MRPGLLLALLSLWSMSAMAETLYRWVDGQGNVHFSGHPPPPNAAKKVDELKMPRHPVSDPALPFALQQAMKNHPIILYVAPKCAPCNEAQALLSKRGIPYTEKDPQKDAAVAEELRKLTGELSVPALIVGKGAPLKGFESGEWEAALDAAGYPKTGVVPRPARKTGTADQDQGGGAQKEKTPEAPISQP